MTENERLEEQRRELERLRARLMALEHAELERVQSQETLRQSEERFQKIFNHSNDAVFVIDPSHDQILDVNAKACTMLGYTRDELLATTITAIHPDEMPELLAFARSVFEAGSGWTNELTCLTKSGKKLPAEISASVIDIGDRSCMIALVRDITDRKRAEAALQRYSEDLEKQVAERTAQLRRSEERQRVLLEVNNAIITHLDRESLFEAITNDLSRILSFDRASITLYDPERDVLKVYALAGPSPSKWFVPLGEEFPRQGSHLQSVLDQKQSLIRRDLEKESRIAVEELLFKEGIRSTLAVPMLAKRRVIGTLNVGSREPNRYSNEDAKLLREVATQVALALENMLAYEEIAGLKAKLHEENIYLQEEIKLDHNFEEIISRSDVLKKVLRKMEQVASTPTNVLILGETGTGKELFARAIHNLSPRRDRPLVKVNCAALPSTLIESELFGHERGAFTGAFSKKVGRFELADGGTIFLDEIGDLPLELQAKLLRVLQEAEFERLGNPRPIKVNVRVIAATNRDLKKGITAGNFREDLYYRLNVFPIALPPLRERKGDIPLLVKHFARKYGQRVGKVIEKIPQKVMSTLEAYPWPGNVRELENIIERAVILSTGSTLQLEELLDVVQATTDVQPRPSLTLEEVERNHIIQVLEETGWRVEGKRGAAVRLGLNPSTLRSRMEKLAIQKPQKTS